MRTLKLLSTLALFFAALATQAQNDLPKGFSKGSITLADGSIETGYIKEKIRSNASVIFLGDDKKKKNYDGSALQSAVIGDDKYICIKGDFFKIITDGNMKLLQKSSDASTKPIYNGNQAVFANGTEGNPGDYFLYSSITKQLRLATRKSIGTLSTECFAGCDEAIAKAKTVNTDMAKLNEAVDLFNKCSTN